MLQDVDDLQIILRPEFRFANPAEVRYRQLRSWRGTRYIELEDVLGQNESLRLNRGLSSELPVFRVKNRLSSRPFAFAHEQVLDRRYRAWSLYLEAPTRDAGHVLQ